MNRTASPRIGRLTLAFPLANRDGAGGPQANALLPLGIALAALIVGALSAVALPVVLAMGFLALCGSRVLSLWVLLAIGTFSGMFERAGLPDVSLVIALSLMSLVTVLRELGRPMVSRGAARALIPAAFIALIGVGWLFATVGIGSAAIQQRYLPLVRPLIGLAAGVALARGGRAEASRLVLPATIFSTITAAYAAIQHLLGRSGLLSEGYEYGNNIREIGGSLRAFGFSVSAIPFADCLAVTGLFLAVVAFDATTRSRERLTAQVGLVACIAGCALGLVRTPLILLLLGVVYIAVTRASGTTKTTIVGSGALLLVLLARGASSGGLTGSLLSLSSWRQRIDLWGTVDLTPTVAGHGLGTAGVSKLLVLGTDKIVALSTTTASQRAGGIVDNYYITTYFQLGVAGLILLALIFWGTWRADPAPISHSAPKLITLFLLASMVFHNTLEDWPTGFYAMSLLGFLLATRSADLSPDVPRPHDAQS